MEREEEMGRIFCPSRDSLFISCSFRVYVNVIWPPENAIIQVLTRFPLFLLATSNSHSQHTSIHSHPHSKVRYVIKFYVSFLLPSFFTSWNVETETGIKRIEEREREKMLEKREVETKKVINETSDRASKAFISITFIAVIIMKYVLEY